MTVQEIQAHLESMYVWPGGYAKAVIFDDGDVICDGCAQKHAERLLDPNDWAEDVSDFAILWEGQVTCTECGGNATVYGEA